MSYWKFSTVTDSSSTSIKTTSTLTTFYAASSAGFYVEAYGPIVRRSNGDPEWSPAASSTDTSTHATTTAAPTSASTSDAASTAAGSSSGTQSDGGLSTGAKVGIGVGVSLGALILIGCVATAYIIGRRRRAQAAAAAAAGGPGSHVPLHGKPAPGQAAEMDSAWAGPPRQELEGQRFLSEMGPSGRPAELHG